VAKKRVDIEIRGRDNTRAAFRSAGRSASMFRSALGSLGALAGGLSLGYAFREIMGKFNEQELAARKLDEAYAALGDRYDGSRRRAAEFAAEIQRITTLGDEAVLSLQTLGINIAGLKGNALEAATQAAIGLGRALNIDAAAAMQLVARAAKGQMQTLTRYGIVLDLTKTKEEQYQQLVQVGLKHFQEYSSRKLTFGEQWQQVMNSLGDTMERVGAVVADVLGGAKGDAKSFLATIRDGLDGLNSLIDTLKGQREAGQAGWLDKALGVAGEVWDIGTAAPRAVRDKLMDMLTDKVVEGEAGRLNNAVVTKIQDTTPKPMFSTGPAGVPSVSSAPGMDFARAFEEAGVREAEAYSARRRELLRAEGRQGFADILKDLGGGTLQMQAAAGSKEAQFRLEQMRVEEEIADIRKRTLKSLQDEFTTEEERAKLRQMLLGLEGAAEDRLAALREDLFDKKAAKSRFATAFESLSFRGAPATYAGGGPADRTAENTKNIVKALKDQNKVAEQTLAEIRAMARSGVVLVPSALN
jgi:hypothetical protein